MKDDLLWVDVTEIMQHGHDGFDGLLETLNSNPVSAKSVWKYAGRLNKLIGITEIELHIEAITGTDMTIDVVVDIFNRVNSGGTTLSRGDLALAKLCAEWPDARQSMKHKLSEWAEADYVFTLDWLLRSVNTVLTGEAKFSYLHDRSIDEIQEGLKRASIYLDTCLNMIAHGLGLDHNRVLFGRYALPVMVHYLDHKKGDLSEVERDKLLFWFVQAGMWGRFSGSTESYIDRDIAILEKSNYDLSALVKELKVWTGNLKVKPEHFDSWSLGSRFYPVLYMLTRMGDTQDWCTPWLPLKKQALGTAAQLELHHIFPKSKLYKLIPGITKPEVNAVANYCFLTKKCNLEIGDNLPEEYFAKIENDRPGALASQWIPDDPELWKIKNYPDFLDARRKLLAGETNRRLLRLLHDDSSVFDDTFVIADNESIRVTTQVEQIFETVSTTPVPEDVYIQELNTWMEDRHLPHGQVAFELTNEITGVQRAIIDLAWPDGIQQGRSEPVAVLLNEPNELLEIASAAGYRCFTSPYLFRSYVESEILGEIEGAEVGIQTG